MSIVVSPSALNDLNLPCSMHTRAYGTDTVAFLLDHDFDGPADCLSCAVTTAVSSRVTVRQNSLVAGSSDGRPDQSLWRLSVQVTSMVGGRSSIVHSQSSRFPVRVGRQNFEQSSRAARRAQSRDVKTAIRSSRLDS